MARTPRSPPLVSVVPGRQPFLRKFALLVESADGETADSLGLRVNQKETIVAHYNGVPSFPSLH